MIYVPMTVAADIVTVPMSVSAAGAIPMSIDYGVTYRPAPRYAGQYVVTPGQAEQTLLTADMVLADNIKVGAIPSNYGLITWNGSTITVS